MQSIHDFMQINMFLKQISPHFVYLRNNYFFSQGFLYHFRKKTIFVS